MRRLVPSISFDSAYLYTKELGSHLGRSRLSQAAHEARGYIRLRERRILMAFSAD